LLIRQEGENRSQWTEKVKRTRERRGLAFVHAGGTIIKRELQARETLRVDTGCLVAFSPSVSYDIQLVGGDNSF